MGGGCVAIVVGEMFLVVGDGGLFGDSVGGSLCRGLAEKRGACAERELHVDLNPLNPISHLPFLALQPNEYCGESPAR